MYMYMYERSYLPISYIPLLMAECRIYWERANYQQVERVFRASVEFCSENDTWKLNVAHVLFMQVEHEMRVLN